MTYAAVGQLTYSDFPALGFGAAVAAAAQSCNGGRVSDDGMGGRGDFCCQTKTWSNATYKAVLGSTSWQYYNERRVRRALNILLDPTGSFSNGLDQVAWDFSLPDKIYVQPGFYDRLKAAAINYWNKQHPPGRWKLDKTGTKAAPPRTNQPACSGGWYSTWRATTGTTAAKKVINSVPGSESHLNRNARPGLPDAATAQAGKLVDWRLVRIKSNEVVPTAWTKSFIDVFARAALLPASRRNSTSVLSFGPASRW